MTKTLERAITEVNITRKAYMQEYSCGKPTSELTVIGTSDHTATTAL